MSFFKGIENLGKSIVHKTEDVVHNITAPIENVISETIVRGGGRRVGTEAKTAILGGLLEQNVFKRGDNPFFPKGDGDISLGQQIQEIVFPGSTDTQQGQKARDTLKKISDVLESDTFRKVGKTAAKVLEVGGAVTGQPELVAAGTAIDLGLAITDDAREAGTALKQAVDEKDFGKLLTAVNKGNKIAQKILGEQQLEDETFNKFARNVEIVEKAQTGELKDIFKAVEDLAKENFAQRVEEEQADNRVENELRAIEQDEEKQEVELEDIERHLNPPQNFGDMLQDIVRISDAGDVARFIEENIELFSTFSQDEQNRILDAALDTGVFAGVFEDVNI